MVGRLPVETGQLPGLHSTYSVVVPPNRPSLNQRSCTLKAKRSVSQDWMARTFQSGVAPEF